MEKHRRINYHNGAGVVNFQVGSSSPSGSSPTSSPTGANCIVHHVSKFDTLAGVAIKYGVEVSEIKRLNGLMTDFQMFALKTILIPSQRRHPCSPTVCSGHHSHSHSTSPQRTISSDLPQINRSNSDFLASFQSLRIKSPSEQRVPSSINGFYGLGQPAADEATFEMAIYRNGVAHVENGPFSTSKPSNPPLSYRGRSKSIASGLATPNPDLLEPLLLQQSESNTDKSSERMVRRRQKSVPDFSLYPPEKVLKEDNSGGTTAVSTITGNTVALRPKSATRGTVDSEPVVPVGLGDSFVNEHPSGMLRRASSGSNFQDSDNGALSSIWPASMLNLKADFQAISIFDGLHQKPRNKAAID